MAKHIDTHMRFDNKVLLDVFNKRHLNNVRNHGHLLLIENCVTPQSVANILKIGLDKIVVFDELKNNVNKYLSNVFIPLCVYDDSYYEVCKFCVKNKIKFDCFALVQKAIMKHKNMYYETAIRKTHDLYVKYKTTHYDEYDFYNIMQALDTTKKLEGVYIECGVMTGTSGLAALSFLESSGIKRKCHFIDTFEGFNYPVSKSSMDTHWNGSHFVKIGIEKDIEIMYANNFPSCTFEVIKSDVMVTGLFDRFDKIACLNLDVDCFDPTLHVLQTVWNKVVVGGIIICEDYGHAPCLGGAYTAINMFLENCDNARLVKLESGSCYLIKVSV